MGALLDESSATMVAILVLFLIGALLVGLSVTKEIKGWKFTLLAHKSVKTRICAGALGLALIAAGVFLALYIAGGSDDDSDGESPADPDTSSTTGSSLEEAWEDSFTLYYHSDRCRDLDSSSMPVSESGGQGICVLWAEQGLSVPGDARLLLWEDGGTPSPEECVEEVTKHGYTETSVTEGDEVCVITAHNRVAVVSVLSTGNGLRVDAKVWGPLRG